MPAETVVTLQTVNFSGLRTQLQKTFSAALGQTAVLRLRWESTVPGDWAGQHTVLDSGGHPWTVLTSRDGRRIQLWSPETGRFVGDPLAALPDELHDLKLTVDQKGELLLALMPVGATGGNRIAVWNGSSWTTEAVPAGLSGPLTWTSGPVLWGMAPTPAGSRLVSVHWKSPGWETPVAAAVELPAGPWTLTEAGGELYLVAGPTSRVFRAATVSRWGELGEAGGPVTSGSLGTTLALSMSSKGPLTSFRWLSSSLWSSSQGPTVQRLSSGSPFLYGWDTSGKSPVLQQFDGDQWRAALPLESIAPAGTGPWAAEFLPAGQGARAGLLVLLSPVPTGMHLGLYELP